MVLTLAIPAILGRYHLGGSRCAPAGVRLARRHALSPLRAALPAADDLSICRAHGPSAHSVRRRVVHCGHAHSFDSGAALLRRADPASCRPVATLPAHRGRKGLLILPYQPGGPFHVR